MDTKKDLMSAFENQNDEQKSLRKSDLAFCKFERVRLSRDKKQLLIFIGKYLCVPLNIAYIKKVINSEAA